MYNDPATRRLDQLVTVVANHLMTVDAATSLEVSQRVLAYLVDQLGVDVSFLRHNDHDIRATILVAEWPPRPDIPDPDPLGVIYFAGADPVFALCEHSKTPHVFRPEPTPDEPHHITAEAVPVPGMPPDADKQPHEFRSGPPTDTDDYQHLIEEARGVPVTTMAAVPLVSGDITTGMLGFIKYGDREWNEAELTALMTIATLFAQVQARVAAEEQLRYLADHDDLTGLHNRRALLQHLDQRLSPGEPGPVAALFLDLDRLKTINDYLGHAAGDQFIHVFAQRIRDTLGDKSLIARLGGDEFVIVPASPLSAAAAQPLAERLRDQFKEHVAIGGEVLTRTVSIGVASATPGQDTPSDLLRWADQAVLAAKHTGGDSAAVFTADMSIENELRNDIELHLRSGIESDALRVVYLPEVDLRTGDIIGFEALVRWQHPTRGLLSPDVFIPVAESINLAGELDRWVLRTACSEFAAWRSIGLGHDALLRINVSPGQLVTGGFVDFVADMISQHGLDASSVCLEITENVVVQDLYAARATLARLNDIGVRIAIDDFGTGYSAMSLLQTLPVDTLKIDKAFVRRLGTKTSDLVIVRSIMVLAQGFQLDVVAEGIETESAARVLLEQRCYRGQGFLFSRPVPGEAMRRMLSAKRIPLTYTPPITGQ
jgi:diguanylate cyclase (GGDEF)-like protein